MNQLYPILLDISKKRILIIGGGSVAARKARGVLDAGATDVAAVAPDFCDSFPAGIRRIERGFEDADLDGVWLCFTTTDNPVLNARIVQLCQAREILVNRADRDNDNAGDFTVPAVHRAGAITVAVSAAGSPAIAAGIRTDIAKSLDPAWGEYASAMATIRRDIVESGNPPEVRQEMLRLAATHAALEAYKTGGISAVRILLAQRHLS